MLTISLKEWFDNCNGRNEGHDLRKLAQGIDAGLLNAQDDSGLSGLGLAISSNWQAGVEKLSAGADTELYYFHTGDTALHLALQTRNEAIIKLLIKHGANPDAGNHWGISARVKQPTLFDNVPEKAVTFPEPRIQNAEHLADHYRSKFKIPKKKGRERLQPGQAVILYVYGPKSEGKQDTVKVRISARTGSGALTRYVAAVETPFEQIHLPAGTEQVEFGPENVATIFLVKAAAGERDKP